MTVTSVVDLEIQRSRNTGYLNDPRIFGVFFRIAFLPWFFVSQYLILIRIRSDLKRAYFLVFLILLGIGLNFSTTISLLVLPGEFSKVQRTLGTVTVVWSYLHFVGLVFAAIIHIAEQETLKPEDRK